MRRRRRNIVFCGRCLENRKDDTVIWYERRRNRKICRRVLLILLATSMSFSAYAATSTSGNTSGGNGNQGMDMSGDAGLDTRVDTGFILMGPDSYDSEDTALLFAINQNDDSVTFLNLELGKKYTLSMDGTTKFFDKYGESISLDQLEEGDIVDVTFLKSKKHLNSSTQLMEQKKEVYY